jgi:hypothetical protein
VIKLRRNDHNSEIHCLSCDNLGLEDPFQGTCFRHTISKACQYGKQKKRFMLNYTKRPSNLRPRKIFKSVLCGKTKREKTLEEWTKVCMNARL